MRVISYLLSFIANLLSLFSSFISTLSEYDDSDDDYEDFTAPIYQLKPTEVYGEKPDFFPSSNPFSIEEESDYYEVDLDE